MREGVVIVIRRGERFLVIRRAEGILAGGAWCFAGGAIEPGESQADAVVREFAEEMGARVDPIEKIWEYRRPDGGLLLHWWTARLSPDTCHLSPTPETGQRPVPQSMPVPRHMPDDGLFRPNPAEVAEWRWHTLPEILKLPDLLESNRTFINVVGPTLPPAD